MDAIERGPVDPDLVEEVAGWLRRARQVVALTGAGVSTASGIPDYRGPNGLWTRDPANQRLVTIGPYLADPEVRRQAWLMRASVPAAAALPNPAHQAFVALERRGRLHALITQNVDGLHQAAGSAPDRVVEVHGSVREVLCLDCDRRRPMAPVLERVRAGEADPRCTDCGGIQKAATISFGQSLDPAVLQRAHDAAIGCDLMLAVGSSLSVHPVALLPRTAIEAGARLVVVNAEPTPYDDVADAVFQADVGEVLTALVEASDGPAT